MFLIEKGFSLIQVLIIGALLGGLSLFSLRLVKNIGQAQSFAQSKADEIQLQASIRMILDDEKFCRVSLAGNGASGSPLSPVIFEKKNIDEEDEGLDISLFLSNQAGDERTLKKFNGQSNPGSDDKSQFGNLTIKSLKLLMNNPPGGSAYPNYDDSPSHTDMGIVRVNVEKKISKAQTREITFDFDIRLWMSTGQSPESSGETRILSCSSSTSSSLNIDIIQVSSIIPTQSGTIPSYGYAECSVDRTPISCGVERQPSTGAQDDIGCRIDLVNNRCVGWRDQDSGPDPNLNVFCYCIKN